MGEATEDPRHSKNTYLTPHVALFTVLRINGPCRRLAQNMTGLEVNGHTVEAKILLV